MLTQKDPAASMRGHVLELRPAKKATSGGSSDTEAKEPTAMPTGPSPSSAVMTVTPVGKWPRTWRNLAESNEVGVVTKGEGNGGGSAPRRSEERRGGKECVRTCRYRGSPYHQHNNQQTRKQRGRAEKLEIETCR